MISPSKPRAHIHYAWLIVLSGCAFMGTTLGALGYTVGNFFLPVSRELGCGVVPMEAESREWRERTGRVCCALALRAKRVVRIWCGIPTVLKGENE